MKKAFILFFVVFVSCKQNVKFNKAEWVIIGDCNTHPNREKMLIDLTENHKLRGLTYKQLVNKIGEPEKDVSNTNGIYYEIVTDYEMDIDPVYVKNLEFEYNNDSIITEFKISEYKHGTETQK